MSSSRRHRAAPRRPLRRIAILSATVAAAGTALVAGVVSPGSGERSLEDQAVPSALRATVPTLAPPRPPETVPTERPEVPNVGGGTFTIADGSSGRSGDPGTLVTYRVEVEDGLPYEADAFAAAVETTLASRKGWSGQGYTFERNTTAPLRVVLASPETTDDLCAPLRTEGEVSCRNGEVVAINAKRWTLGANAYGDNLEDYRIYVVNHEIGHALGHFHEPCPAPGAEAPVMLQQTLGLDGCRANPWP